jgi:hypothetical protein
MAYCRLAYHIKYRRWVARPVEFLKSRARGRKILGEIMNTHFVLIPVAARSKAWACGSLAGVVGVVCFMIEVSASGWSLIQRGHTECGVSECDREASIMRKPWPTRAVASLGKSSSLFVCFFKAGSFAILCGKTVRRGCDILCTFYLV